MTSCMCIVASVLQYLREDRSVLLNTWASLILASCISLTLLLLVERQQEMVLKKKSDLWRNILKPEEMHYLEQKKKTNYSNREVN